MTSARDRPHAYDVQGVSRKIAAGHSWKHVEEGRFSDRKDGKYGPDLRITNRAEFSAHIAKTMLDNETQVFRGVDFRSGQQTRDIYHNVKTNTTVVVNRADPDFGTCIRGSLAKEPELDRLLRQDNQTRDSFGLDRANLPRTGGYKAIYPEIENIVLAERPSPEIAQAQDSAPTLSPDHERQARIDARRAARETRKEAERETPGPERGR